MKLELDSRLRVFAALARHGSFSRAADELLISQPAVSRHISDLEKDLGILLVQRHPHGAKLTAAGEYLAQYALRAEALLAQADRGLKAYSQHKPAALNLAASGTPGNYLLPPVLSAYQQANPQVTVSMFLGTSSLVVDAVRSHRAELGIVGGLASADELEVELIYTDDIVLVGPPALSGKRLTPRQLRDYPWLMREPGSSTRQIVETTWQDLGILPQSIIELPSWEAIKLAAAAGSGITACSRLAIGSELKAGTLVVLDVPAWNIHRSISLIKLAGVELSKEAEEFRQTLVNRLDNKLN